MSSTACASPTEMDFSCGSHERNASQDGARFVLLRKYLRLSAGRCGHLWVDLGMPGCAQTLPRVALIVRRRGYEAVIKDSMRTTIRASGSSTFL